MPTSPTRLPRCVSHSVPIQALSPYPGCVPMVSCSLLGFPQILATPPQHPQHSHAHTVAPWPAVSPAVSPCIAHLKGLPSEVTGTELALDPALGAAVLDVLGEVPAAQFGAAPVGAGDHVEATGAKMGLGDTGMVMGRPWGTTLAPPLHPPRSYLEVLDEPTPAAALLAVDAADGQAQHLRLQLGVGVDLEGQQWGISLLHRAAGAQSPQHSLAGSLGHAARGRIPPGTPTNALCWERVSAPRPPAQRALASARVPVPARRGCARRCAQPGDGPAVGMSPWSRVPIRVPGSPWHSPGAAGPLGT